MPNEGDTRFLNGEWQMYVEGKWVTLDPNDPEDAADIADLKAAGLLAQFGEAGEALRQVHEEAKAEVEAEGEGREEPQGKPEPIRGPAQAGATREKVSFWPRPSGKGPSGKFPAYLPWPPMMAEDVENDLGRKIGTRQVEDLKAIIWAYEKFGYPAGWEEEKPEALQFATPREAEAAMAQAEAESGLSFEQTYNPANKAKPYSFKQVAAPKEGPLAEPEYRTDARGVEWVRTSRGGDWKRVPAEEPQGAPPGGWPGREQAAPRKQSIEDLITDALVSGDTDRALVLDDFRQRPSAFQLAQFAQSLATTPEDFLKIYQALQDAQAKSFEALGAGGQGFAGAVSPDQAARLVHMVATGQIPAAPPTVPGIPEPPPFSPPGTPRPMPTPPPGLGIHATDEEITAGGWDIDLYYSDPGYREAVNAEVYRRREEAAKAKGGLWGKKPGEPGYEAQQAMEYAQAIGGQGIQALPETPEGQLGGFVVDISNLTPEQMQSQFGPMVGPTVSDIEDMTFEQLAASNLPDQQKEYWRKRKQARIAQGGFAQTVAGFVKPKPKPFTSTVPRAMVFTR